MGCSRRPSGDTHTADHSYGILTPAVAPTMFCRVWMDGISDCHTQHDAGIGLGCRAPMKPSQSADMEVEGGCEVNELE